MYTQQTYKMHEREIKESTITVGDFKNSFWSRQNQETENQKGKRTAEYHQPTGWTDIYKHYSELSEHTFFKLFF